MGKMNSEDEESYHHQHSIPHHVAFAALMASARHGMAMKLNREYDVKNYKFIIIIVLSVFVGQFSIL